MTMSCSLPVQIVYQTPVVISQPVSEYVAHYPVLFHPANVVLYRYSLSGVDFVALFFFCRQISLATLLSVWQGRYLLWKVFPNPQIPKVKHADNLLWGYRVILLIDVIVVSVSFLVACFMDDDALVVNHELCLYGVPFPLARIVRLPSSP